MTKEKDNLKKLIKQNDNERLELKCLHMIKSLKLSLPVRQYKFLENRNFRFDFAWIEEKIALEVEGGIYTQGRHTRGSGFIKDCEKYNLAILNGWKVFRVADNLIENRFFYEKLKSFIEKNKI